MAIRRASRRSPKCGPISFERECGPPRLRHGWIAARRSPLSCKLRCVNRSETLAVPRTHEGGLSGQPEEYDGNPQRCRQLHARGDLHSEDRWIWMSYPDRVLFAPCLEAERVRVDAAVRRRPLPAGDACSQKRKFTPGSNLCPPNVLSLSRVRPSDASGRAARRLPRPTANRQERTAAGVTPWDLALRKAARPPSQRAAARRLLRRVSRPVISS
jgi:hypothetical protein